MLFGHLDQPQPGSVGWIPSEARDQRSRPDQRFPVWSDAGDILPVSPRRRLRPGRPQYPAARGAQAGAGSFPSADRVAFSSLPAQRARRRGGPESLPRTSESICWNSGPAVSPPARSRRSEGVFRSSRPLLGPAISGPALAERASRHRATRRLARMVPRIVSGGDLDIGSFTRKCDWLNFSGMIHPDGRIGPCCVSNDEIDDFADSIEQLGDAEGAFNSSKHIEAPEHVRDRGDFPNGLPEMPSAAGSALPVPDEAASRSPQRSRPGPSAPWQGSRKPTSCRRTRFSFLKSPRSGLSRAGLASGGP